MFQEGREIYVLFTGISPTLRGRVLGTYLVLKHFFEQMYERVNTKWLEIEIKTMELEHHENREARYDMKEGCKHKSCRAVRTMAKSLVLIFKILY